MRGECRWKVKQVLNGMELEDRHARSRYGSLKIVYHAFRVDELIDDGVVVQN